LDGAVKRPLHLKEEVGEMIRYKSFADTGLIPPTGAPRNQVYVDSNYGSNSNFGSKEHPYAGLDYAVGMCSVSGDTIYLMPGHSETITAGTVIDIDVGGLNIVGLGNGSDIPTINYGTGTTVDIDAANISIKNVKFVSSVNAQVAFLDVNHGGFTMEDCILQSTAATSGAICFIDLATTKDNFTFKNCQFINDIADPVSVDGGVNTGCFYFVDSENIFVENCFFNGYFETAIFHNKTTAAKNVWTKNCYGIQILTGAEVYTQVANMSGGDINSLFIVRGSADVLEASTWGALSANFFLSLTSGVGNDGSGGQVAVSGSLTAS
jgi:hypothetical protein